MKSRKLRTGYTTVACAAAAAKAATLALLDEGARHAVPVQYADGELVEIPFPDGTRHRLKIAWINCAGYPQGIFASLIKDAGDDPDVTNGAEIIAKVVFAAGDTNQDPTLPSIVITGGGGVGKVTRPGLLVSIGETAINPGPRKMIREAVMEALRSEGDRQGRPIAEVEVTIWVPEGESIAPKTLNSRLGIVGGFPSSVRQELSGPFRPTHGLQLSPPR